jgi:hypothetical protein
LLGRFRYIIVKPPEMVVMMMMMVMMVMMMMMMMMMMMVMMRKTAAMIPTIMFCIPMRMRSFSQTVREHERHIKPHFSHQLCTILSGIYGSVIEIF